MVKIKDVIGFEDRYTISDDGVLFSKRLKRPVSSKDNGHGYIQVRMHRGREFMRYAHRLVAEHFLDDWDETLHVDHVDGDRANNTHSNLRMVTRSQNMRAKCENRGEVKYRGVSWNKRDKRFFSQVTNNEGRTEHLGSFTDPAEAAFVRDKRAVELGYFPEALNFRWLFC